MREPDRAQDTMPPFRWGDRHDVVGLSAGLIVAAVLWAIGAPWWWIVLGCACVTSACAFLLRRHAGAPQVTIWQRLNRKAKARR
jgi:hypothetical protein